MKTLHLSMIIGSGITIAITMGILFLAESHNHIANPQAIPMESIQNNSFYTVIDTPGLNSTYSVYQTIHFSVIVHGYGFYPCIEPDVTIYNNDNPQNPVYRENRGILTCKAVYNEQPENYTIYYQEPDHPYITRLNQTGNYTLNVSVGDTSMQKQFTVVEAKYVDWSKTDSVNELTIEDFKDTYKTGEKIDFTINFKGLYVCGVPSFTIRNIENRTIWESPIMLTLCDPDTGYGKWKWKFGDLYNMILNQTGLYHMRISFSDKTLEKEFEITKQPPTYLLKTVDEWKNQTFEQLHPYYEKYKDNFYTELGAFLIKDEMKKELERQKIVNIHDDFQVFPGMTLDSLPPHISYDSVVNATDGNSYLLLGSVFANKIEYMKITKLVFDKDVLNSINSGGKLPYTSQFAKTPKVVISEQAGNNPLVEPYDITLDLEKNNLVTFYNNLTIPIRIEQYGSGLVVDEDRLPWKTRIIGPHETVSVRFNQTGYYEWSANSPPKESENWWDFKGSGQIVAFSQNGTSPQLQEKVMMAETYLADSDIPKFSMGYDGKGLEIGLYASVHHMIPDAQKYYTARAKQLIPFDVPIIISNVDVH